MMHLLFHTSKACFSSLLYLNNIYLKHEVSHVASHDIISFFIFQGRRMSDNKECGSERPSMPSISLLHEELEDENYIFRTTICEELET